MASCRAALKEEERKLDFEGRGRSYTCPAGPSSRSINSPSRTKPIAWLLIFGKSDAGELRVSPMFSVTVRSSRCSTDHNEQGGRPTAHGHPRTHPRSSARVYIIVNGYAYRRSRYQLDRGATRGHQGKSALNGSIEDCGSSLPSLKHNIFHQALSKRLRRDLRHPCPLAPCPLPTFACAFTRHESCN